MGNPLLPCRACRDPLGRTLRALVEEIKAQGRYRVDPSAARLASIELALHFGDPLSREDQAFVANPKRPKARGARPRYHAWAVRELCDIARQFWAPNRDIAREHVAAFLGLSFEQARRLDARKASRRRDPDTYNRVEYVRR